MSISHIKLKKFNAFQEIEMNFSTGINVLVGENGSGKTQLMKAMYACKEYETQTIKLSKENYKNYFGSENPPKSHSILIKNSSKKPKDEKMVFIPTKDMLTHSKGFLSICDTYDMPFDKTQTDILKNAFFPKLNTTPTLGENVLKVLEETIGGTVSVEDEVFYVAKQNGEKVRFSLEAEGFKKFALLWQLILNGRIGENTVLFWDEPEANVNPSLLGEVAKILLELAKNKVQIFIATHSYVLAKYLEIKCPEESPIQFHSFYKNEGAILCESNHNFRDLKKNLIISSYDQLLDEVYSQCLEE